MFQGSFVSPRPEGSPFLSVFAFFVHSLYIVTLSLHRHKISFGMQFVSSLLLLSVAGLQLASAVGTIDAKLASIADDIDDNLEALDTDGPPTELKDGLMVMAMARSRRRRRRRAACNCICDRGRCCRAFPQVKAALQYEGADGKKMNCCEQPFYNGGEAENFQGGCVKLLRDGPNGGAKRERFLQAMTTHKSVQEEDKEVQEDDVGESVCSCGCTEATCCRGGGRKWC